MIFVQSDKKMYHGSPWYQGVNNQLTSNTISNLSSTVLHNTPTNSMIHSPSHPPASLIQLVNNLTPVFPSLQNLLLQHQSTQVQPTLTCSSSVATNQAGAFLLQQILPISGGGTRLTPNNTAHSSRLGVLQQHFVHNFSFTNSNSYHSEKKPPTPPRRPASPEDPPPVKSLYPNIQNSLHGDISTSLQEEDESSDFEDKLDSSDSSDPFENCEDGCDTVEMTTPKNDRGIK